MSILETLHEEHKARQQRLKQAAFKALTAPTLDEPTPPPPPPDTHKPEQELPKQQWQTAFEVVMYEVCSYYNIRKMDVLSYRKSAGIPRCRLMVEYMAYRMTTLTNPQIGLRMGRDHTSVRYSLMKVKDNIGDYQEDINELEKRISLALSQRKVLIKQG